MRKRAVNLVLVWLVFFIVFSLGQASIRVFWSNDDPYYHARHSALINETGNLTLVEPWLTMHFLSYAPTDPWWGFHAAMAFFIHFFGVVWGSKILSALLAASAFAIFYFILVAHKVSKPLLWTVIFWGSSVALLSRLLLERPHLLTLPVLMLAWHLGSCRRYWWLFALSIVYTLAYHLAPLIMVIIAAQLFIDYWFKRQFDLKLLMAALGGILGGILLHPQSLNYVYVMFVEIWQVLYLRFSGINLNIGGEMITMPFWKLLQNVALPLIFYLPTAAAFLAFRKDWPLQHSSRLHVLGVISAAWLVVALVVPRAATEYWLPFAWLFSALTCSVILSTADGERIKNYFNEFITTKITRPFIYALVAVLLAVNIVNLTLDIREANTNPMPGQIKEAAEWLSSHTPEQSVVFYDNWSYWPLMFYYNQRNRYLTGMEPTLAYEYNHDLYWTWRNISVNGFVCDRSDGCPRSSIYLAVAGVADAIRNKFQSEHILVKNDANSWLYKVLVARKQDFVKVFGNDGFVIYKILAPHPTPPQPSPW